MTYQAPIQDYNFILNHVLSLNCVGQKGDPLDIDLDIVNDIFVQADKFCQNILLPIYHTGEKTGCQFSNNTVTMPDGWQEAYGQFVANGYNAISSDIKYGGMNLPKSVSTALFEMISSSNLSFGLCPLLTQGAIHALEKWGSDSQKNLYLPKLVSGKWTATMNLTEPQAGSDVGKITAKAVKSDADTYKITGTKIYITFGDHDLSENIIHLVLARLPNAPEGTKGISLFLVPKFMVNDDGTLGEQNDIMTTSIEHKLGIHASPTCTLTFGEQGGAIGYLIGQENQGLKAMFTMMNDARLSVAAQGVGVAEIAYQKALAYAKERMQGKDLTTKQDVALIQHPDIQRSLTDIRSLNYINRLLVLQTAHYLDKADAGCETSQQYANFLIPIAKSWATDLSITQTSNALQVFGGAGFIEETQIACHYRDARILSIYEGTSGIQAIDLVTRKLCHDDLRLFRKICSDITDLATNCLEHGDERLAIIGDHLDLAVDDLLQAGEWMYQKWGLLDQGSEALAGATPFLKLAAIVISGYYATKAAFAIVDQELDVSDAYIDYTIFFAENYLSNVNGISLACTRGLEGIRAHHWL
ncbi:MAG: alkylation response protein AidB-like acyl-CoA dehydrogenase [Alphaproteobacteria bacterium]|jgi:alkylation response protein AidB-like acyl-CoA dehydrogenase